MAGPSRTAPRNRGTAPAAITATAGSTIITARRSPEPIQAAWTPWALGEEAGSLTVELGMLWQQPLPLCRESQACVIWR